MPATLLLLLFGIGSVLFLPVIAIAGLRMIRLEPAGRIVRGLLFAMVGAVLLGVALGLTGGSADVGGAARRMGQERSAWRARMASMQAVNLIRNPSIAGPGPPDGAAACSASPASPSAISRLA